MQIRTKMDGKMQRELFLVPYVASWVILAIGGVGILAYILISACFDVEKMYALLGFSAIMFTIGLIYVLVYSRIIKSASMSNKTNIYTFSEEFVTIETEYHGEILDKEKLFYSDIYKIKETKRFIFVYPDMTKAYPIEKKNVQDIDTLRRLLFSAKRAKK